MRQLLPAFDGQIFVWSAGRRDPVIQTASPSAGRRDPVIQTASPPLAADGYSVIGIIHID